MEDDDEVRTADSGGSEEAEVRAVGVRAVEEEGWTSLSKSKSNRRNALALVTADTEDAERLWNACTTETNGLEVGRRTAESAVEDVVVVVGKRLFSLFEAEAEGGAARFARSEREESGVSGMNTAEAEVEAEEEAVEEEGEVRCCTAQ